MKSGSLNSTAQAVQFLNQVSERRCSISDAKLKGLQLERLRMGVGKWRLRCEDEDGRGRSCLTLGDAPLLSLAEARILAEKVKKQITMGERPSPKKALPRQVPTVNTFIHDSYLPFIQGYKRSWKCDEGLLRKHIEPAWGKRYLDQITKADLISLMAQHRTTHAPGSMQPLAHFVALRVFLCHQVGNAGHRQEPDRWHTPDEGGQPKRALPQHRRNPAPVYPASAVRQPDASVHRAHADPHGCQKARGAGCALGGL